MGWVNANLTPINVAPTLNLDCFVNGGYINSDSYLNISAVNYLIRIPQSFWTSHANQFVIGDANNGIYCQIIAGDQSLKFYHNGLQYSRDVSLNYDWGEGDELSGIFVAGYDTETQKGTIGYIRRYYGFAPDQYPFSYTTGSIIYNDTTIYEILLNTDVPTYTWQAVPSIVGKSAVSLDLSVILDINNGEAVTTSDASKFDLNNDSNVITLVNNVINQNE